MHVTQQCHVLVTHSKRVHLVFRMHLTIHHVSQTPICAPQDKLIDRFLKNVNKMPMVDLDFDLESAMQTMLNNTPVRHGGRKVKAVAGPSRNLVARGPSWAPQYTEEEVSAYLASRFAGCFSSAWAVLEQLRWRCGGWAPRTMLDYGAGPGTATWAAAEVGVGSTHG